MKEGKKSGRWALLKQVSSPHREVQREEELFSYLSIRDMAMYTVAEILRKIKFLHFTFSINMFHKSSPSFQ